MIKQKENIIGQYASDHFIHGDKAGFDSDTSGVDTRGDGNIAFHHEGTLFDATDNDYDETTGRRIGTDPYAHLTEVEGMAIVSDNEIFSDDSESDSRGVVVLDVDPVKLSIGGRSRARREEPQMSADEWMKLNGKNW